MIPVLARLAARVRERGLGATVVKTFGDHLYRRSTSVIVEWEYRNGPIGGVDRRPSWLTFVTVRTPDALPPLVDWLRPREASFRAMLTAGKVGFFALDKGCAVGCIWLSLTDHHDAVVRERYVIRPREGYHYCWLIDPDYRRRNVALSLCRYFRSQFDAICIDRCFGVVDRDNRASYLVMRHLGFRERGVAVIHTHLLNRRWTRMRPYAGVLGTSNPADRAMHRA